MGKHIRNWVPCSAFSKFSLGTLSGIALDLVFPGTVLIWIGIFIILFSISVFLPKRFQIAESFVFGILFLLVVTVLFPSRFQREEKNTNVAVEKKTIFGKLERKFQEKFRERILLHLQKADLEKNSHRVALGLIFGEPKQLSKEFKQKAKEGGILHLFAASGLHLGILMGVQFSILSRIPGLGHNFPRIIPLLTGFIYLSALGYPVSLARAWIFAGMLLFQGLFFRNLRPVDLLLGSAWILWIWDPSRFYTVSFCLSFGAVTGIFLFSYPIKHFCNFLSDENFLSSFFKENLSISFSAGLGTMPVLLFAFGSFSFGSVLLNLLVVPLAGILLPILYLSLLLQETKIDFIIESSWSITEFLIQILSYLSNTLSKPLGFYKEMGDAVAIGILGWLCLALSVFSFAWISEKFFLNAVPFEKNFKNIQNSEYIYLNTKRIFSKKILPFAEIGLISWIVWIYILLYKSPELFPIENRIINNRFFFLLRNGDSLFLSGKCKYGFRALSKTFQTSKKNYCDTNKDGEALDKIFVEDESCLTWAFQCISDHPKIEILYAGRDPELWAQTSKMRIFKSQKTREIRLQGGSTILFFHTKKDSLEGLFRKTRTGRGWILLETPFGSKDNAQVWNRNRKLLGLPESWVFLEKDELQRIPISESF
ncbi:ComEC/Rec2 family competence protein [Leptospira sp. WS92.C1]